MARITVEDCINKVKSAYELVLIAKERAVQLNSGDEPKVDRDNDKNTVIALREIAEDKVSLKGLEESAVTKLRKVVEESQETEEEEVEGDDFESLYKGEISKSGVPILPSKRARKIPIQQATTEVKKEKVKEETAANQPLKLTEEVEEEKK